MADAGHLQNETARSTPAATLGFGCARLLMQVDRSSAVRLIETALEAGIRHIDVARSYGDGHTEAIIGEASHRRRQEMTIVTKAGLCPPGFISRAGRKIASAVGLKRAAPSTRRFGAHAIRQSVEQSLRALKSDYVDALLLHDCGASQMSDELQSELCAIKQSGKALRIGIAADVETANSIAAAYPRIADILQIEAASMPMLKAPPAALVVTHSILASRRLEIAPARLLGDALHANCGGVVLFSSCNREHIRSNASLAQSLADGFSSEASPAT
jgi:D-threo-aldose 1-dehydrogenase